MTEKNTVLIEILDPQAQDIRETVLHQKPNPVAFPVLEAPRADGTSRRLRLSEAAATPNFPNVLRTGLRPIMLSEYAGFPSTYKRWIGSEMSDREYEYGLEFNSMGELPVVPEGKPFSEIEIAEDRTVNIHNRKRGAQFNVTYEMLKYEKTGQIREATQGLGRAMAYTVEKEAYDVLTTAANYTRAVDTDNLVGNNTGTVTFSAGGLVTAMTTLMTMFDQKSGQPLGVVPDTLVVGVGLQWAATQLLTAPELSGMGDTDAVLTYGTGTANPFRGQFRQIIATPLIGVYEWVVLQAGKAVREYVVEETELLTQGAEGYDYFKQMTFGYRVARIYGMGMWNDRFAYYSDSTTAATVT